MELMLGNVCRFNYPILRDIILLIIDSSNKKLPKSERRHGGYLVIRSRKTGEVMCVMAFGEFPPEKAKKYFKSSLKKSEVLFKRKKRHLDSYEIRNHDKGIYGGAVIGAEFIFAFTGCKEEVNEGIVCAIASLTEPIDSLTPNGRMDFLFSGYVNKIGERNKFLKPSLKHAYDYGKNIEMKMRFEKYVLKK